MTMSYAPAGVVDQGDLPATFNHAQGLTWDGQQLVVVTSESHGKIGTIIKNADGTFTASNLVNLGDLVFSGGGNVTPQGMTWDGTQLVIVGARAMSTLARSGGTYTPANAVYLGLLPVNTLGTAPGVGVAWDGQQLVLMDYGTRRLSTLARSGGTYIPANAVLQGTFPAALSGPSSLTWDGTQLITCGHTDRELFTLARDADNGYTPADAVSSGTFASSVGGPRGLTWDGDKLVIIADA